MIKVINYKIYPRRTSDRIASAGLSDAVKHMLDREFAIFTSSRGEFSRKENETRLHELKRTLRGLNYGFINTYGAWKEEDIDDRIKTVLTEDSIFVPKISEQETLDLCKRYEQEAYIYGNNGTYWIKGVDGKTYGSGPVREHFRQVTPENDAETFTGFKKDPRKFTLDRNRSKEKTASQPDEYYFFSIAGNPKYVTNRFGINHMSDPYPDAELCDAWFPLRIMHLESVTTGNKFP